ncbi:MAG: hypothetical protein OQK78_04680 [Gammaproteobacteria bacterium]|nr:hypothetical protein [Gammaproteobacteria bacterium]
MREICFCPLHPDLAQAHSAGLLLSGIDGVDSLRLISEHMLHIHYDVRIISLQMIEEGLVELGYHLDNSLLLRLKRSLFYYTEEIERDNLGVNASSGVTPQLFIQRYQKIQHGCRDQRPQYWRNYL